MKCTRDMNRREFKRALDRAGFRHEFAWWYKDTTGQTPNTSFGAIVNVHGRRKGKTNHRATLAKLIRSRAAEVVKAEIAKRAKEARA